MMYITSDLLDLDWLSLALYDYVLHPFITVILCLLSVFVVFGNLLVVSAIWHEHQMHSVTNYLIASLAAADCLVGAVVMPFSIISEIIVGSWTFGPTWCDMWHSFDVLASTASIMNLCAISWDRYLAITKPITYPTRMTPKIVASYIVSLWISSSLISFPAIIWWRAVAGGPLLQQTPSPATTAISSSRDPHHMTTNTSTSSSSSMSATLQPVSLPDEERALITAHPVNNMNINYSVPEPTYQCVFTDDPSYLLVSSTVSFYAPLCVMLYAYYRIYKAAVQQTRFLKHGSKQVMIGKNKKSKRFRHLSEHSTTGANEKNNTSEDYNDKTQNMERQHLVLRAHRGGGAGSVTAKNKNSEVANTNSNTTTTSANRTLNDFKKRDIHNGTFGTPRMAHKAHPQRSNPQAVGTLSNDLDQSILYKNDHIESRHDGASFQHRLENRANQADLRNSRRDKLRIESQRFDTSPLVGQLSSSSTNSNSQDANSKRPNASNTNVVRGIDQKGLPTSTSSSFNTRHKIDLDNREGTVGNLSQESSVITSPLCSNQDQSQALSQVNVKPLVASINMKSSVIDISILDKPNHLASIQDTRRVSISNLNEMIKLPAKIDQLTTNNERESNIGTDSLKGKNRILYYDQDSMPLHDDIFEGAGEVDSTITTSSSATYGTGSIASVKMRSPGQQDCDNNEKKLTELNCDDGSMVKRGIYMKARRALSTGEAMYIGNTSSIVMNKNSGRVVIFTKQQRKSSSTGHSNHRASCSEQSIREGCTAKAPKSLSIKSWVKSTRQRSRDKKSSPDGPIKPPASLLPLMMMNSDTSSDSSVATTNGSSQHCDLPAIAKKSKFKPDPLDSDTVVMNDVGKHSHVIDLDSCASMASKNPKEVVGTRRPSGQNNVRKSVAESGKGQVLYYESDKLTQSIVDLTSIHYIDCQSDNVTNPESVGQCTVDLVSDGPNKKTSETSDRIDTNLGTGNSAIAPQQRSVGKKLSKLAKERKAAKTLGIVVGVFVLCWLPFFVINIIVALCGANCVHNYSTLSQVVTWLGWLNSAMNPVIYACWSRDFRRAFRRVLLTWMRFICPYRQCQQDCRS